MNSDLVIIHPITADEAREHIYEINNAAADMGRRLLELKERQAWIALGYSSWSAMLSAEFSYSRKHLYELMNAAPILEQLLPTGNKVSTKAAAAISAYDSDLQPAIVRTAIARYGQLTESNVNRVGSVIQEMATTGHVDTGNGTSTPVDAALNKEDVEAALRQQEYIADKLRGTPKALQSSASNEWYTPAQYIEAARALMGNIELDPASCERANRTVQAKRYYTQENDGLSQSWRAKSVWLNPPYGREGGNSNQDLWSARLIEEYRAGNVGEAVLLVNAVTDRQWFQPLWDFPICFTDHRIHFYGDEGSQSNPTHGNVLVYFGKRTDAFINHFKQFGVIVGVIARREVNA